MSEVTETVDLWGDIITEPIRTPLTILKEQGALLERKTNGILTLTISSSSRESEFIHRFSIHSPVLNYSYLVVTLYQPIEIYPIQCSSDIFSKENDFTKTAHDEKEFLEILKEILQSPKIQKVINTLLSQSVTT